jgi:UDP-GlcNAc:undecaprenyl-phosphate/decaprenyl-phosphate GlcNAc-1-phosphate transferase
MPIVAPLLVAFAASVLLVPLCRLVGTRFGFVANPREDRWHKRPIAMLGGVAIGIAILAAMLAFGDYSKLGVLAVAAGAMFLMGLADDIWSLKPATKLVVEIGVAALFLFYGHRLNWANGVTVDWMLTLIWIVGITNAFNLLDNMDGLCGGIALIAAAAFLISVLPVAAGAPAFFQVQYLAALVGALVGFLVYNVHPASIFMGDSGSLLIGMSLAGLTLTLGSTITGGQNVISVIGVPMLVMLIPIFDTTLVTISRMVSGRPTSVGGRDHTSHRLVAIGLSERAAVALLWTLAAAGGAIGVAFRASVAWWSVVAALFAIGMTMFAAYLGGIRVYESSDAVALKRGSLTPIVVDFVYRRRVAEIMLDFVLVTVSYYTAYRLKFDFIEFAANFPLFMRSLPVVVAVQLVALFAVGVYQGVWRHFSTSDALTVVRGVVLGTAASMLILLYMFRFEHYSRTVLVIYGIVVVIMVTGSRASFRVISEALQRRRQTGRRVVIYGAGDGGAMAVRELLDPEQAVRIVGLIDDDPVKRRTRVRGYPVLGNHETLAALIATGKVDAVVLSTPAIDSARVREVEALCVARQVQLARLVVGLESLVEPDRGVSAGTTSAGGKVRKFRIPSRSDH